MPDADNNLHGEEVLQDQPQMLSGWNAALRGLGYQDESILEFEAIVSKIVLNTELSYQFFNTIGEEAPEYLSFDNIATFL